MKKILNAIMLKDPSFKYRASTQDKLLALSLLGLIILSAWKF